jgi:DNA-directed RNA polymerase subunit RPC12/RpoP
MNLKHIILNGLVLFLPVLYGADGYETDDQLTESNNAAVQALLDLGQSHQAGDDVHMDGDGGGGAAAAAATPLTQKRSTFRNNPAATAAGRESKAKDDTEDQKYSCVRNKDSNCCRYHTNDRGAMMCHAATKHFETEQLYQCSQCGEKFKTKVLGFSHLKNHDLPRQAKYLVKLDNDVVTNYTNRTEKTSYECDICNRNFSSKIKLITHKRVHRK